MQYRAAASPPSRPSIPIICALLLGPAPDGTETHTPVQSHPGQGSSIPIISDRFPHHLCPSSVPIPGLYCTVQYSTIQGRTRQQHPHNLRPVSPSSVPIICAHPGIVQYCTTQYNTRQDRAPATPTNTNSHPIICINLL